MVHRGYSSGDQRLLGKRAGLSESAVSRHLKFVDPPRRDSVEAYATALNVSVEWLTHGRGSMEPEAAAGSASRIALQGHAALEALLEDYDWPSGTGVAAMDAAVAEARADAETEIGRVRPASVWRAFLAEATRKHIRKSSPFRKNNG